MLLIRCVHILCFSHPFIFIFLFFALSLCLLYCCWSLCFSFLFFLPISFYDDMARMCPFKQAIRIITSKDSFWHKERDTQWKIILSLLWLIKSYFMFHGYMYKEMTVFPSLHDAQFLFLR